ncbi:hypothetical protein F5Y07DRAFT_379757 [Xylaria sp. FL0933]|nr:hypothetical protein F5Y07DRAFT_379757 [Xylaria sp. FL0933]
MNTPISQLFKLLQSKRKKSPGDFGSADLAASSPAPNTNLKAGRHESDKVLHDSHAEAQTSNIPSTLVSVQNDGRRINSTEVAPKPGKSATTSSSRWSKANSLLGVNNEAPVVNRSIHRFQDASTAFRRSPERRLATPGQPAVELPADQIASHVKGQHSDIGGDRESGPRVPSGVLEMPSDSTTLTSRMRPGATSNVPVTLEHLDGDELHFGNLNQAGDYDLTSYHHRGQYSRNTTPVNQGLDPGMNQHTSAMGYTDPKTEEIIRHLKKRNAELVKDNKTLKAYKDRCDILDQQRTQARRRIGTLTEELQRSQRIQNEVQSEKIRLSRRIEDLEEERTHYSQKLEVTELTLKKTEQVLRETQNLLTGCEERLRVSHQENDRLRRRVNELQQESDSMNKRHEANVSLLKEEYRSAITHLEQEKRSISAKAQKDLETANNKHDAEVFGLNEKHRRETNDMRSKFEEEMKSHNDHMQSIVDEKSRTIAAQDIRMASYNKQIHGVIPDGELERKFRGLALSIDNLVNELPRPESFIVDTALDPDGFLRRNSPRGSRVWPKFLRKMCWEVLIRGFFYLQPGFGSFGCQGDGYLTLLHLYKLFITSDAQNSTDLRSDFPNNKTTNSWRASLFGAILNQVTSTINDNSVTGFPDFFRNHVRTVRNHLIETLQKLCQKDLDSRCSRLVLKLCNDVGLLSLQLGAQQSVVLLETCCHEDWVLSGALFKDDNYYNKIRLQVDIMVQPSLKRIGDGGQDFTTEKVLVTGSIVALKAGAELDSNA